jgi:hypothetical protein
LFKADMPTVVHANSQPIVANNQYLRPELPNGSSTAHSRPSSGDLASQFEAG